jgi:hypothetical protein
LSRDPWWSAAYGANAIFTSAIRQQDDGPLTPRLRLKLLWWAGVNKYLPAAAFVLGPMPDILRWSIQLSIFAVLLGPLFNEIALSFGSHITFGDVLREAERLHFAKVLSMMKQILFSS